MALDCLPECLAIFYFDLVSSICTSSSTEGFPRLSALKLELKSYIDILYLLRIFRIMRLESIATILTRNFSKSLKLPLRDS